MFRRKNKIDNIADLIRGKEKERKYHLTNLSVTTGSGAAVDSQQVCFVAAWKKWRVVNCGFITDSAGSSTIAELVNLGIFTSDASATNQSYFGALTQDITAGKNWVTGDMFQILEMDELVTPDPPANGGNVLWTQGAGLNVWQQKAGSLMVTKKNVASSTSSIQGWFLIEIGDPNDQELVL